MILANLDIFFSSSSSSFVNRSEKSISDKRTLHRVSISCTSDQCEL
jgi:hypothetical protein